MKLRLRAALLAVGAAAAVAVGTASLPAAAAAPQQPALLPMTIQNSTAKGSPAYLYVLGHFVDAQNNAGPEGYLTQSGDFRQFPTAAGPVPETTDDASIAGPSSGSSTTVRIPFGFSGRLYYSFDKKIPFQTVIDAEGRTSLVQPVPWIPESASSSSTVDFDWVELSYTSWGLYLNSSQVDQVATPAAVSVTDESGTLTRGVTNQSVAELGEKLAAVPGFEKTVQNDGGVLRLINPSKLTEDGRFAADYLDEYISAAWAAYQNNPLTVRPYADDPGTYFTGRTSGNDLVFTDARGVQVETFTKPSTSDVLECDGALHAPNDKVRGPIARSLCADLNRGVFGTQSVSPALDAATFYKDNAVNGGKFNYWAKIIHEGMVDGRAYAFAFDDVAAQESLVHATYPVRGALELLPEAGGSAVR